MGIRSRGSSLIGRGGGSSSSGQGGVWVYDASRQGGTFLSMERETPVSGESVPIIGLATDAPNITLLLTGDRTESYEPVITVNGVTATRINTNSQSAISTGTFQWSVTIPTSPEISVSSSEGGSQKITVVQESPAIVSNLRIVDNTSGDFYPSGQTEVKAGDPIFISFDTDKDIRRLIVVNSGAGASQSISLSAGSVFGGIQVTCGAGGLTATLRNISILTETTSGAVAQIVAESSNQILCNNIYPTVVITDKQYPSNQLALKNSESATLTMNASDLDTIVYSSPSGQISIVSPEDDTASKSVSRLSGSYNVNSTNIRIVANRVANNATTTVNDVVFIANIVPTLSVVEPSPMKSGGNDNTSLGNYTVTINSTQRLLQAPLLVAPEGTLGAFSHTGSSVSFSAVMSVSDNDPKGIFQWDGLSVTGISGMLSTIITGEEDYTFSGIKNRSISVPPFGNTVTVHASLATPSAISCVWDFTGNLSYSAVDVLSPDQFTIINITATTFDIKLLDAPMVAASSQASTISVGS